MEIFHRYVTLPEGMRNISIFPYISYNPPMIFPWNFPFACPFSHDFPTFPYDFPICVPCFFPLTCQFPMVPHMFLWFSHDFPHFPHGFPTFFHLSTPLSAPGGLGAAGLLGPQPGAHRRGSRCHRGDPGAAMVTLHWTWWIYVDDMYNYNQLNNRL